MKQLDKVLDVDIDMGDDLLGLLSNTITKLMLHGTDDLGYFKVLDIIYCYIYTFQSSTSRNNESLVIYIAHQLATHVAHDPSRRGCLKEWLSSGKVNGSTPGVICLETFEDTTLISSSA